MDNQRQSKTVGIVGGGLAGLAAGCALADAGLQVTLFERRPYVGGRASSYRHPGTDEVVDNCQHVLLGCCTNLLDLYRRTGVGDKVHWYDRLTFIEPGGRISHMAASALPAPFHMAPAFLRNSALTFADKIAISRAMLALMPSLPAETSQTFLEWLKQHAQTEGAIRRFWSPVLVSALNEDLDRMSVRNAADVFRKSFLGSPEAGRFGVPGAPLTELYGATGEYIAARGGEVVLRGAVESFETSASGVALSANGERHSFDFALLAVPFEVLGRFLPEVPESQALRNSVSHFETSPITGIHLWFDREISDLDHAVLLDRTIQWMFHKSRILGRAAPGEGSYVELVVSSSKTLVEKSKQEIVDLGLAELREFFPAAREANLVKSTVIKEVNATYAPRPGIDAFRPGNATAWPRVFIAGDWTASGWPATMEGAVRSGYLAAEALARTAGQNAKFLVPDLPARGLMRLFE